MVLKITSAELQVALDRDADDPIYLVDSEGQPTHVVLSISKAQSLLDDWLKREVDIGFDQAACGETHDWNLNATLCEARRRRAERLADEHVE